MKKYIYYPRQKRLDTYVNGELIGGVMGKLAEQKFQRLNEAKAQITTIL